MWESGLGGEKRHKWHVSKLMLTVFMTIFKLRALWLWGKNSSILRALVVPKKV